MDNDEILAPVLIGLAIFAVALIVMAMGEFYGSGWNTVAQGVTTFTIVIVIFAFAAYVLIKYLGRR